MKSLTLKAPAKINLYLNIINKRKDGYHNIETIFQKVGLCDKIKVSIVKKGISVYCNYPGLPPKRANLCYKAAQLMKKRFCLKSGLAIHILKKIPPASGLGGGSSDAASVITAVNRLFNLKLTTKKLMTIAKEIGADVPFFVSGYNCAVGTGIGERLKNIRPSPMFYTLILVPGIKIYTKTIYRKISLPLTRPGCGVSMLARLLSDNRSKIRGLLYNRLEEVVLPAYPIVKEAKEILSSYKPEGVLLSGSGSAIFAIFNSRKEAMKARRNLERDGRWQLFLTRTA